MSGFQDPDLARLLGGVLALLILASAVGAVLARRARRVRADELPDTIANLNARIRGGG